jgi:predicted metal-dependent RNase
MLAVTILGDAGRSSSGGLLIETTGLRLLVDPGGQPHDAAIPASAAGTHLDAIVVTHAHGDHSAGLPFVLAAYPEVPVLATPATLALLKVLDRLPEALAADRTRALAFNQTFPLAGAREGAASTVRLLRAGHALGAASVVVQTPEGCVVCSGDVSLVNQHTVRRAARPHQRADLLVLESTYGDREFRPRMQEEARLVDQVRAAQERGGHVLLAVLPYGPAQEILLILAQARLEGTLSGALWVDGLVGAVNEVYAHYAPAEYTRLARFMARHGDPFRPEGGLVGIAPTTATARRALLQGPPLVMVTDGPSVRRGPSAWYAGALASDPAHLILRPAGAPGQRQVAPAAVTSNVRCRTGTYGLMSHADGEALAALAARWQPELVVLHHGELHTREALQARLAALGLVAVLATPDLPVTWP